jgi:hypothetical protein
MARNSATNPEYSNPQCNHHRSEWDHASKMMNHSSVNVTSEFGLIVRRNALVERGIGLHDLFSAMDVGEPFDSCDDLLSFGPHFGREAADTMVSRLTNLGFVYFDDFFEFCGDYPAWCMFRTRYNPSAT